VCPTPFYALVTPAPPVEADVEVKDGKLDILIRKSPDAAPRGADWQVCGLAVRKRQ